MVENVFDEADKRSSELAKNREILKVDITALFEGTVNDYLHNRNTVNTAALLTQLQFFKPDDFRGMYADWKINLSDHTIGRNFSAYDKTREDQNLIGYPDVETYLSNLKRFVRLTDKYGKYTRYIKDDVDSDSSDIEFLIRKGLVLKNPSNRSKILNTTRNYQELAIQLGDHPISTLDQTQALRTNRVIEASTTFPASTMSVQELTRLYNSRYYEGLMNSLKRKVGMLFGSSEPSSLSSQEIDQIVQDSNCYGDDYKVSRILSYDNTHPIVHPICEGCPLVENCGIASFRAIKRNVDSQQKINDIFDRLLQHGIIEERHKTQFKFSAIHDIFTRLKERVGT